MRTGGWIIATPGLAWSIILPVRRSMIRVAFADQGSEQPASLGEWKSKMAVVTRRRTRLYQERKYSTEF
ncbi:hypothetical protein SODALDRAFT_207296 [Sodiomyces alkalinus F11]|uniref:Secreted protein n=1 Tax=Sodiomyces alkalinus (strain CBS 110278 / VKM F-3762 / F11) TaxID=1314773 RepID=A0A3N2PQN9_SODAK|nr:hypothetical protein SODALDRAFT_207296 [Sodiomyces alkalinus F11]ROT36795.1 hypothetical protein SODALDRAFT_207296 [Sodiomyces alkalinus F11]